jgi:hypothetical protein
VLAQTFGWYKTCECITSTWAGAGGYLDFSVQDISNSSWVLVYWTTGTVISGLVMILAMFYITVEVSGAERCCPSLLETNPSIVVSAVIFIHGTLYRCYVWSA